MTVTEAQMMRDCAPLYPTIAIEALSGFCMGCMFLYLWMKVSTKNDLKSPVNAVYRLTIYCYKTAMDDLKSNMCRWGTMATATMGERFAFCRKANQAILLFQAIVAFISITRWLHIGNVNGFRYLGYAITCPNMQAQLILLIAPIVPCYRICFAFTMILTFCMLIEGWIASTRPEPLFNCDWNALIAWDDACFEDHTLKFWMILPCIASQTFLSFLHIPLLGMLYVCKGGGSNPNLPPGYLKLLCIVSLTWLGFPAWWFCSYEGMGLLTDTKLNAVGFALMNVVAKGALAFHVLEMTTMYRHRQAQGGDRATARELGMHRPRSGSTDSIMAADSAASDEHAVISVTAWVIRFLRNFDDGAPGVPPSAASMFGTRQNEIAPSKDFDTGKDFEPVSWTRQTTAESGASTSGMTGYSGESEMWDGLEPMYKRFLTESGVSQNDFVTIGLAEKVEMRSKFDKTASAVLVGVDSRMTVATPQWTLPASVSLADATDEELLKEMRRRMSATSAKNAGLALEPSEDCCFRAGTLDSNEDDDGIPECELDIGEGPGGNGRRNFNL